MARTPIKRKPGRSDIWQEIRRRIEFTVRNLYEQTGVIIPTVRSYVNILVAAGVVEKTDDVDDTNASVFRLVKDLGRETPKFTKDGKPSKQGLVRENMWRTMKRINGGWTVRDLAITASTSDIRIKENDASSYLKYLKKAGYVRVVKPAKTSGGREQYAFNPRMNTGPLPPQIQRIKQVFDPNTQQITWSSENV